MIMLKEPSFCLWKNPLTKQFFLTSSLFIKILWKFYVAQLNVTTCGNISTISWMILSYLQVENNKFLFSGASHTQSVSTLMVITDNLFSAKAVGVEVPGTFHCPDLKDKQSMPDVSYSFLSLLSCITVIKDKSLNISYQLFARKSHQKSQCSYKYFNSKQIKMNPRDDSRPSIGNNQPNIQPPMMRHPMMGSTFGSPPMMGAPPGRPPFPIYTHQFGATETMPQTRTPFGFPPQTRQPPIGSNLMGPPPPGMLGMPPQASRPLLGQHNAQNQDDDFEMQNPWDSVSQKIRELFHEKEAEEGSFNFAKGKLEQRSGNQVIKHEFHQKNRGKFNTCCNINIKKSYTCFNCSVDAPQRNEIVTYVICAQCFDPSMHQGHYFTETQEQRYGLFGNSNNNYICLCGKDIFTPDSLIKPEEPFLCGRHEKYKMVEKQSVFKKEQFIAYFQDLYYLCLYETIHLKGERNLNRILRNTMLDFIEDSPQNCRIVVEMFLEMKDVKKKDNTRLSPILFFLDNKNTKFDELFSKIIEDQKSAEMISEHMASRKSQLKKIGTFNMKLFFSILTSHSSCLKIFLNHHFFEFFSHSQILALSSQSPENYFYLPLYCKLITSDSPDLYCLKLTELLYEVKPSQMLKIASVTLLPKLLKGFVGFFKKERKIDFPMGTYPNKNKMIQVITHMFLSLCSFDRDKIINCREFLPQIIEFGKKNSQSDLNVSDQDELRSLIEQLLEILAENYEVTMMIQDCQLVKLMIPFLALKSPKSHEMIERIVEKVTYGSQSSSFQNYNFIIEHWREIIRIYCSSRLFLSRYENHFFIPEKNKQISSEYRRRKLYNLLHSSQKFEIEEIHSFNKFYALPDFNKIILEQLVFNPNTNCFDLKDSTKFKKQMGLLQFLSKQTHPITLSSQNFINEELQDPIQDKMVQLLFGQSTLLEKVQAWIQKIIEEGKQKPDEVQDLKSSGQIPKYISFVVSIFLLTKGTNPLATKLVELWKTSETERLEYELFSKQNEIKKILCIEEEQKEELQKFEDEEIPIHIREKALAKKKQKHIWMKEKQKQFMENLQKTQLLKKVISKEGESCIICRQKSKKDNQLVYLIKIASKWTNSSILFGKNNVMNTNISSCFHPIHVDCYFNETKTKRNYSSFKCPLCQKDANSIIPEQYDLKEKKLLFTCTNSIISTLFTKYEVYDVQNIFLPLFKHLIESKVFLSLTNQHKYKESKERRNKIDFLVEEFLHEMFKQANEYQKKGYAEDIALLQEEVNQVEGKIMRKLQQFFVKLIWTKITTGKVEVEIDKLLELSYEMQGKEFAIIMEEIEDVGGDLDDLEGKIGEGKAQNYLGKSFPITPPQFIHQIKDFGNLLCHFCPKKRVLRCLICGVTMCQNCEGCVNHKQNHHAKIVVFNYDRGTLQWQDQNKHENTFVFGRVNDNQSADLYYTDLMVPFGQRNSSHRKDVFRLNEAIFAKLTANL